MTIWWAFVAQNGAQRVREENGAGQADLTNG